MPKVSTKTVVRIDQKALARELKSSQGTTGRTIAAFAGLVTREVNKVFIDRAGGKWWPVKSTIFDGKAFGASATVRVKPTKAHRIVAVNRKSLTFQFPDGTYFNGYSVMHPGSSVPEHLVQEGITNALTNKELAFFRPAPKPK
jgi:hypothetical protein